jgi:hypothetical protein
MHVRLSLAFALIGTLLGSASAQETRTYENRLIPIKAPKPLLADYPDFVAPIEAATRFEAPVLVDDRDADLHVRAWRYSYNARCIIEMPNRLRAAATALIVVHPWGVDDGQGWRTPEPAGAVDFCTPAKNQLVGRHSRTVVNPFLKALRGKVAFVMYSLINSADPIRKKRYRTFDYRPTKTERAQAEREMTAKLASPPYKGQALPAKLTLSAETPVRDYFRQFPGLDAGPRYNGPDFWNVPVPVEKDIDVDPEDVLVFDVEGYPRLRDFLKKNKVRHVLLTGYATDKCFCQTTAGYENLSKDFNVFLVGDATLATFPAHDSPRCATTAAVAAASLHQLVTQVSWVRYQTKQK